MKKQPFLISCLAVVMATACTGITTGYTSYDLNRKFSGYPADQFFNQYGFPEARFDKVGNGAMYRWSSLNYEVFPAASSPEMYHSSNGNYEVAEADSHKQAKQYCQLHIYVDRDENIRQISIAVDTPGWFGNSRCAELFE